MISRKRSGILVLFIIWIVLCSFDIINLLSEKTYQKNYFSNGTLKSEGWVFKNKKVGYWKFYFKNGQLKKEGHYKDNTPSKYWYFYSRNGQREKEGHFKNGKKSKWWLFYDKEGNVDHKCQLKDNHKNGYCLIYKRNKLVKASKYKAGIKIKEWTDFSSFKQDNNAIDLN